MHWHTSIRTIISIYAYAGLAAAALGQHLMAKRVNTKVEDKERFGALNRWGESTRLWKTDRQFFPREDTPRLLWICGISLIVFGVVFSLAA